MAIIYSYPNLTNLEGSDLLLVSDMSSPNKDTKNITVSQIVDLIPSIVPGGGTVTSVGFSTGTTGLTVTSDTLNPITTTGTFTLAGTLAQAHGGTGLTTYAPGDMLFADDTGNLARLAKAGVAGKVLTSDGVTPLPSWQDAASGTVTSVELSIASGMGLTWTATSGANPITTSGDLELGGTLAVANGGTGATTANGALTNLLPSQGGNNGKVLTTDGAVTSWIDTPASGVTTISFDSTGLTPATPQGGAIVVAGKLISDHGGTGYNNSDYTTGDMLYKGAASLNRLGMTIADAGKILTVNATGDAPEWSAASAGLGGSGTAGRSTRFTASTTVGDGALFDNGLNLGLGAAAATGTGLRIDGSDFNNYSVYIRNTNSTDAAVGIGVLTGTAYSGSNNVTGITSSVGGTSTGTRIAVSGLASASTSGINIGLSGEVTNAGTGDAYAARFVDGQESVGRYWKCVTAQGDGQWADVSDLDTTYTIQVPSQGANPYAAIDLVSSGLSPVVQVKMAANLGSLTNTDLDVAGDDSSDTITYAHKDVLGSAKAGSYTGISSLTLNAAGHVSNITASTFQPSAYGGKVIDRSLGNDESSSIIEIMLYPFTADIDGQVTGIQFQTTSSGLAVTDKVYVGIYEGNLEDGTVGASNTRKAYGESATITTKQVNCTLSNWVGELTAGTTYLLLVSIDSPIQLISQDLKGTLLQTGGYVTGVTSGTTVPSTLSGVTIAKQGGPGSEYVMRPVCTWYDTTS